MRAILVLIGIVAIVIVVLMALGMLRLEQEQGATMPTVVFQGGSLPSFKAETGTIGVGSTNTSVDLPTVEMKNTTIQLPTIEVKQAGNTTAPAETE